MNREPISEIDQLKEQLARTNAEVMKLNDEIERLRAWAEEEQQGRHRAEEDRMNARTEVERLKAALEPFARNVDAVSLSEALGHIERKHLRDARAALEPKP